MQFAEEQILRIIARVGAYMQRERERHFGSGVPLNDEQRALLESYFSAKLLDAVRVLVLEGARIDPAPFSDAAKALGFTGLPDFEHLASFTYVDVIVFPEKITPRTLFHGLVHAAQFSVLGLDRYVDRYVRAFVKTGLWIAIPLEEQAFKCEARFAHSPPEVFSVEDEIRLFEQQGRYQ